MLPQDIFKPGGLSNFARFTSNNASGQTGRSWGNFRYFRDMSFAGLIRTAVYPSLPFPESSIFSASPINPVRFLNRKSNRFAQWLNRVASYGHGPS